MSASTGRWRALAEMEAEPWQETPEETSRELVTASRQLARHITHTIESAIVWCWTVYLTSVVNEKKLCIPCRTTAWCVPYWLLLYSSYELSWWEEIRPRETSMNGRREVRLVYVTRPGMSSCASSPLAQHHIHNGILDFRRGGWTNNGK